MKISLRAITLGDKKFIEGYASLFNVQSRLISENRKLFREIIRDGAFDEILRSEELNVIANIDHDMSQMLGRTASGTLKLTIDSRGLRYKIEVPDTQLGRDVYTQVERGDYYESSFAFGSALRDVEWGRDREDGMLLRFVNKVSVLRDVAIVRNGAYKNTDVSARSDDMGYVEKIIENTKEGEVKLSKRSTSDILIDEDNVGETEEVEETIEEIVEETQETETEETTEETTEEVEEVEETTEEVEETNDVDKTTVGAEVENAEEDERSWEAENKAKFLEIKTFFKR